MPESWYPLTVEMVEIMFVFFFYGMYFVFSMGAFSSVVVSS